METAGSTFAAGFGDQNYVDLPSMFFCFVFHFVFVLFCLFVCFFLFWFVFVFCFCFCFYLFKKVHWFNHRLSPFHCIH